jgi:hypothetical protein
LTIVLGIVVPRRCLVVELLMPSVCDSVNTWTAIVQYLDRDRYPFRP